MYKDIITMRKEVRESLIQGVDGSRQIRLLADIDKLEVRVVGLFQDILGWSDMDMKGCDIDIYSQFLSITGLRELVGEVPELYFSYQEVNKYIREWNKIMSLHRKIDNGIFDAVRYKEDYEYFGLDYVKKYRK